MPGYMNFQPGRGFWGGGRGRGRGGGWGWRHRFHATGLTGWQRGRMSWAPGEYAGLYPPPYEGPLMTPKQEADALRAELRSLEETAARLRERMQELEAAAAEKTES
jgi:hypothetical protein